MLGNVASPINVLAVSRVAQPAGFLSRIAANAGLGGLFGLTAPAIGDEDFFEQKKKQAMTGAGLGAGTAAALTPVARAIAPRIPAGVQELREMGVVPTIGQRLGGNYNRIEQGLTSAPLLGSAIREARNRTIEQFNIDIGNRVLAKVDEQVPKGVQPGHDLVDYVGKTLSNKYSDLLPNLSGQLDPQLTSEINTIRGMTHTFPDPQRDQFERILQSQVLDKFTPAGLANGEKLKEIEQQLGHFAAGYRKSDDFDKQQLGQALREVQASLRGMIERQNPNRQGEL